MKAPLLILILICNVCNAAKIEAIEVVIQKDFVDPFVGDSKPTFFQVGLITRNSEFSKLEEALSLRQAEKVGNIPLFGILAELKFLDKSGTVIDKARIYLPYGLLVTHDFRSSQRLPGLNLQVLKLLQDKVPDYIKSIKATLESGGYNLESLTSAEQGAAANP